MKTTNSGSTGFLGNVLLKKFLLTCGMLASLLYIGMNLYIPVLYEGYNVASQAVSELSAIGAPTRPLWMVLGTIYTLLTAAFGVGIIKTAGQNQLLRMLGILMTASGIIGLAWTPMHQREVLAAGGGTFTDTWHIIMSAITLLLMLLMIGYGAAALGKRFRLYSIFTIIIFLVFGTLAGMEAPNLDKNLATPMLGVWERINIGAYMIWAIVLSATLLGRGKNEQSVAVASTGKSDEKAKGKRKPKSKKKQLV
jgi:hypothetical protein